MASVNENVLETSEYYNTLRGPAKERYEKKIEEIGFDPYALRKSEFSEDLTYLPTVDYPDIVNYLVYRTSWATGDQFSNWKAMDSYNFFASGWVGTLQFKTVPNNRVLVYARVNHSQRSRETPLKTWFLSESGGTVLTGHCDCMAGLDECCSHVGAMLWAAWTSSRIRGTLTCTDIANRWLLPAYVKDIPYLPVAEMDFTSAKKKKQLLVEKDITPTTKRQLPPPTQLNHLSTTLDEQAQFFANIASCGTKPAILSLVEPFSDMFIPKTAQLPKPLPELLYSEANTALDLQSLQDLYSTMCKRIDVAQDSIKAIEKNTRKQCKSPVWYQQRAGRITASKLKAVCHSKPDKPAPSLITSICYPQSKKFSNEATKWGINKESKARNDYTLLATEEHDDLTVSECGLFVYQEMPIFGASPDGLVNCQCCGSGVCEIKCPYRFRDISPEEAITSKDYCLTKDSKGNIQLDRSHAYYYQVQAQMFVCRVDYCDFIVWTKKGMFVERILPDPQFWESKVEKAELFYKKAIFPELSARWYTRSRLSTEQSVHSSDDDESGQWCYCQQFIEGSDMINCDNQQCRIKWFHLKCIHLASAPDGQWLCPDCFNK